MLTVPTLADEEHQSNEDQQHSQKLGRAWSGTEGYVCEEDRDDEVAAAKCLSHRKGEHPSR